MVRMRGDSADRVVMTTIIVVEAAICIVDHVRLAGSNVLFMWIDFIAPK